MIDYEILFQIFLISFLVNGIWEMNHSVLYTTCYELPLKKTMRLLTIMSLKDGFWISLFYIVSILIFGEVNPFLNLSQLTLFIVLALLFSFVDERVSIKKGRWAYTNEMPRILGVGLTPFLELAVTGVIAFFVVFYIF
ncbi:hypothetical protein CL654_03075 [bacterium]|nr:hypothetical protein [bacterium]|tara:strand:+ start:691 stop:1104 length:414 start_codon:yes stop_codon:yes gene_type:complete